jgi:hypothetical protein
MEPVVVMVGHAMFIQTESPMIATTNNVLRHTFATFAFLSLKKRATISTLDLST